MELSPLTSKDWVIQRTALQGGNYGCKDRLYDVPETAEKETNR